MHQVALVSLRFDAGALEHDVGIPLDIEELRALQVLVPKLVVRVDRGRVNDDGDGGSFGMIVVVEDRGAIFPEGPVHLGHAEELDGKADRGVHAIDAKDLRAADEIDPP